MEWANFVEDRNNIRVAFDTIGNVDISTVFLGFDHGFNHNSPVLFETMVFGGEYDLRQERYYTYTGAEAGHKKWVEKVKELEKVKSN